MKQTKPFLENSCHKCGYVGESKLWQSGKHIKQVCGGCNFYIKFIDKMNVPQLRELKEKIWFMVEGDMNIINNAKIAVEFIEGVTGIYERVQYYKLYMQIRTNL